MQSDYRQTGDVLYFEVSAIPETAKKIKGNLIHQGRDHHHLIEGKFELMKDGDVMFIKANGKCKLTHPEHKTIELPKGLYKKEIVQEYDHFLEESRKVVD
jgi:hypothetical protein